MMIETVLLMFLLVVFFVVLFYLILSSDRFFKRKNLFLLGGLILAVIAIFLSAGPGKVKSDITRIFNNSRPKSPREIYAVLFGASIDTCVRIVNLKDQVIPKIDCCIWMELVMCPDEIKRISSSQKYSAQLYAKADSLAFLKNFVDRPEWWTPQNLSDSIVILHIQKSNRNQQSIIFDSDSTCAFVCDMAL